MDEAFEPLHLLLERLLSFDGTVLDAEAGVASQIYECRIELPVELDIVCRRDGPVEIGSTPPIYNLNTSITPSFHSLKLTASTSREPDGD